MISLIHWGTASSSSSLVKDRLETTILFSSWGVFVRTVASHGLDSSVWRWLVKSVENARWLSRRRRTIHGRTGICLSPARSQTHPAQTQAQGGARTFLDGSKPRGSLAPRISRWWSILAILRSPGKPTSSHLLPTSLCSCLLTTDNNAEQKCRSAKIHSCHSNKYPEKEKDKCTKNKSIHIYNTKICKTAQLL